MENLKLYTYGGDEFHRVCKKAKELSTEKGQFVEFDFNGVTCIVSKDTNLDYLYRDYCNAHIMEWASVGYDCVAEYTAEVQSELDERNKKHEEKQAQQEAEWRREKEENKSFFETKIKDELFQCSNASSLVEYEAKNTDSYGGRCVSYAKEWARAMQVEMATGKKLQDIAEPTSREADYDGITGLNYVEAVSILAQCWVHGEELRNWHNKKYKHDGDGVVNPALIIG